jgi:AcrR family transcriptional regulator
MAATDISADTRARILDAAWRRVRDHGTGAVSVKAIAQEAGVSRQLVYFHYTNRAGLLLAMARRRDEESDFSRRVAAAWALEPVEALEAVLRAWCRDLPDLLPVARALEAALVTGDDGGDVWTDRMDELHDIFGSVLRRVEAAGRLDPRWTVVAAADWTWSRVQPSTYDHLVAQRDWSPAEYTERTVGSLLAELLTPSAR